MVLTSDYYLIENKTKSTLAKELINYLERHDGVCISDLLYFFGNEYSNWEIKQTVMQLVSVGKVKLTSDFMLMLQNK